MAAATSVDLAPPSRGRRRCCTRVCLVGAAGNFSIQYNISVLSLAVAFMTTVADTVVDDDSGRVVDYPEPAWAKKSLLGAVFAGIVAGLLTMGYVADAVGRRPALLATNALVMVGAAATALLAWGSAGTVYTIVAVARFVVGFGVGGIYPTAFATVAEGDHGDGSSGTAHRHAANMAIGLAYLWQMPGAMAPYAVGWLLLAIPAATPAVTSIQWRLMVALGVIPAAIVLWEAWRTPPPPSAAAGASGVAGGKPARRNPCAVAAANPQYLRRLVGTAGTWMMYDASYYGTAIEVPNILALIFGSGNTLADTCWQSLIIAGLGIPGTLLALPPLHRYGARWLNIWGFVLLGASFAALAIVYYVDATGAKALKFFLLCVISLALSWGPSVGVHVLGTMLFPTELRGTFIGLSSTGGKIGGLLGAFMFQPIADAAGLPTVLWVQVAFAAVGLILAVTCLPSDAPGVHLEVELDAAHGGTSHPPASKDRLLDADDRDTASVDSSLL